MTAELEKKLEQLNSAQTAFMYLAMTLAKEMFHLKQAEFVHCCALLVEGCEGSNKEQEQEDASEQSFSG